MMHQNNLIKMLKLRWSRLKLKVKQNKPNRQPINKPRSNLILKPPKIHQLKVINKQLPNLVPKLRVNLNLLKNPQLMQVQLNNQTMRLQFRLLRAKRTHQKLHHKQKLKSIKRSQISQRKN
jgi:hypothetical protein